MSASSASVEEKYIMLEMQRKLEMIESKLNYFMDESKYDQEYDRTSFPILDHNESKFLEHARKQLNMPSELSSKPKTSITRSSVQGRLSIKSIGLWKGTYWFCAPQQ